MGIGSRKGGGGRAVESGVAVWGSGGGAVVGGGDGEGVCGGGAGGGR